MMVDPAKTAHHASYKGVDYHFCNPGCRERFVANPEAYLAPPETDRRAVREEVSSQPSAFETNGHLTMSVEMLVGVGRA